MTSDARAGARDPHGPDAAKVATIAAAVIGAAFSVAALAWFGGRTSLSVAVGAILAVVNLIMLSAILRSMLGGQDAQDAPAQEPDAATDEPAPLTPDAPDAAAARRAGKRGGAAWALFAVLKMVFLFGGVWILLTRSLVDPIPLVIGYGVLPLGITASGLFSSLSSLLPSRR